MVSKREYSTRGNKETALRKIKVTEVKIVRYIDDFKLFCRDRVSVDRMFKLVKIFLKNRLKLEISEKKSKVINLRKKYSYFWGVKFKALRRKNKFTLKIYCRQCKR